ncbi:MAG: hypothetical protein CMN78_02590 [Spirochaetales bacterium]|nr:hypothetical protein [Spirochaetales bacterium]
MEIKNWITSSPTCVEYADKLEKVLRIMAEKRIGAVLVLDQQKLVGVFTERDLVRLCARGLEDLQDDAISRHMTKDPITAQLTDDYNTVYMLMRVNDIRHIPVLDGNALAGIVSNQDLTHFYQNKIESEFADARERIDDLQKLVKLSAEEVLESLFSEINKYKELSLTDHLTGLYNKRYFMLRLREEIARAKRHNQDLSLIFCDIDHFKNVNDNYGHHLGDAILKTVGQILAGEMGELRILSRLRKSDIVARFGGEEFVAILPETTAENAAIAAEKMRTVIAEHQFECNNESFGITMSFGVAGLSDDLVDVDEFIQCADHAMYKAKAKGRNSVATDWEKSVS